jgi:F-type H+-transporting ATPase subunit delta
MAGRILGGANQTVSEAAERYALALFELADEQGALDQTAQGFESFANAYKESAELRGALASPLIASEDKQKAILALGDAMKVSPLVRNFLGVAAQNGRAHELPQIIKVFREKVAARKGVTIARVTSAQPLSADESAKLADALKSSLGKAVEIDADVKPEILGGLIVRVGSRQFDSSIRTKLNSLKTAMKGA